MEEFVNDTGFTWDLVDDLDSRRSFLMISGPLRDVCAFDSLGIFFIISIR